MKKHFVIAALATLSCLSATSAIAGPDWTVIEKARLAKQVENREKAAQLASSSCIKVSLNTK